MTPASTITDPGSADNVIEATVAKEGTKLKRNYTVTTVNGTLTVTAATIGITAFPAEKFGCSGKCGTVSGGMRLGWLRKVA